MGITEGRCFLQRRNRREEIDPTPDERRAQEARIIQNRIIQNRIIQRESKKEREP